MQWDLNNGVSLGPGTHVRGWREATPAAKNPFRMTHLDREYTNAPDKARPLTQ